MICGRSETIDTSLGRGRICCDGTVGEAVSNAKKEERRMRKGKKKNIPTPCMAANFF